MTKYLTLIALLLISACTEKPVPADVELKPATFFSLKGFDDDDMLGAYNAFIKSCDAVAAQSGENLGTAEIKINRQDYLNVCAKARGIMPSKFREFVRANFTPYLVTYKGDSKGKFTAYYEAVINASHTKDDVYRYPVYGRPYDLIELNLQDFDNSLPAKKIIGRVQDNKLVPYYSRAEIVEKGINAPVILWADSYVDVYIMQIQGSAVAHFSDDSQIRISFAESNGRPFKGIGSILLNKGLLEPGQASMGSIKKWLKDNPGLAAVNMNENQRYIFHRLGNPEGPIGALGVPLTAGRSLAVDKDYMPLGALIWLETSKPDGVEMNKLVVAQDIGSAIKGAVRGDYFWGSGGDDVLEAAGKMNSAGQYYVLVPNKTEKTDGQENK